MAREGQRKVKARPKQCQGEVKHNLNRNYNLMGFDTIEINQFYINYYLSPCTLYLNAGIVSAHE